MIAKNIKPFILSFRDNFSYFNLKPCGYPILEENQFDCTHRASLDFFKVLKSMDALSFGSQSMAMEGWTYFDCAAMPGAVIGFGLDYKDVPKSLINSLGVDDNYSGLIPISMFIAIPMIHNRWFGHNLSSLSSHLGSDYKGLGLLTKAIGISGLGIKNFFGATQWGSVAINIHAKLGKMKLISTHTPIHTHENTLCYSSVYDPQDPLGALENNSEAYDFLIDSNDKKSQLQLQKRVEAGEDIYLLNKPIYLNNTISYKIKVNSNGKMKNTPAI